MNDDKDDDEDDPTTTATTTTKMMTTTTAQKTIVLLLSMDVPGISGMHRLVVLEAIDSFVGDSVHHLTWSCYLLYLVDDEKIEMAS